MANVLRTEKKLAVLSALVEGCSVRSTERLTGVHRDTIIRLLVRVGEGCASLLDEKMVDLGCERLELDEIWSFVSKKQRHVTARDDASRVGDQWTYVAIDATTKLIPSFLVGKRDAINTNAFVSDVAARLRNRVQISTDGLRMYVDAVNAAFGENVDYAQIVKSFSKKLENHCAAVALYVAHYNFVRTHRTLRVTPAVAAGVEAGGWELGDLLAVAEERAA